MKKLVLLLAAFAAFCFESYSQDLASKYDIKWGLEEKVSKRLTLQDVVGYDETGFYALKIQRKVNFGVGPFSTNRAPSFVLEHYNRDLKINRVSEINLKQFGEKRELERIINIKDKLYMFTSYADNSDKNHALYAQTIDKQKLKANRETTEVANIDYGGNRKKNSGDYRFKISRDSSKLLVLCMLPFEKNDNEKMALKVFDDNLQLVWQKDVELPYTDELFVLKYINIDNAGNAYLLGKVYHDKVKDRVKGDPNYHYTILSYKEQGAERREYPVRLDNKFLAEMQISPGENGDIVCAGFYSEEGKTGIAGAYYLTVDGQTNTVKHKSLKEFDIGFIIQDMTQKEERKTRRKAARGKQIELYDYSLRDIVLKEGGGAVLIGEQYYYDVVTQTTGASGVTQTSTYVKYNFNDIIVVDINREGDIEWANKIPKRQTTINDGGYFSSYTLAVVEDKLYFVFNDHPKNLTPQRGGRIDVFYGARKAVAVLVEVSADGTIRKKALFSSRDAGLLARPLVCEQVSGNEMIIFCEHRKKHRFAQLTFEETEWVE